VFRGRCISSSNSIISISSSSLLNRPTQWHRFRLHEGVRRNSLSNSIISLEHMPSSSSTQGHSRTS
jgi:hypothetical protein